MSLYCSKCEQYYDTTAHNCQQTYSEKFTNALEQNEQLLKASTLLDMLGYYWNYSKRIWEKKA
jgi:hypothetical protein